MKPCDSSRGSIYSWDWGNHRWLRSGDAPGQASPPPTTASPQDGPITVAPPIGDTAPPPVSPGGDDRRVTPPPGWSPAGDPGGQAVPLDWVEDFTRWLEEQIKNAKNLEEAHLKDLQDRDGQLGEDTARRLAARIGQGNVDLAAQKISLAAAEYIKQINVATKDWNPQARLELNLQIAAAIFEGEKALGGQERVERVLKEAARYAEDARQLNAQAGDGKLGLGIKTSSTGIPSVYDPNMGLYGTISTHFSGAYNQALARGSLRIKDEYRSLANWMAKQLPVSGTDAVTGAVGISLGVYAGVKAVMRLPRGNGGSAQNDRLPDNAIVCRGGTCTADRFTNGSGVTLDANGKLNGVSVNSAPGKSLEELTRSIPNGRVGVTTVGKVRAAGGDVIPSPTPNNPDHCTLCGISPKQAEELFTPTIPNPSKGRR